MGARREADAAIMAVTVSTGPAAVPDDGELADAAAIRESLGQPERFAVLYDRPAELVALFGALKRLPGVSVVRHAVSIASWTGPGSCPDARPDTGLSRPGAPRRSRRPGRRRLGRACTGSSGS